MESNALSLVTFKIGKELYGINIMEVNEIIKLTEITSIPNAPEFVEGVITLRGEIIPVVDLGKRFNFEKIEFTEDEELLRGIIIITVEEMTIGIIIDQVNRVINVNKSQIQPPPQMISGIGAEYIQGVVKLEDNNLLVILNINKLFSKKELMLLSGKQ
ncbi:MAG TPA: chemotaxis protein CheW [Spirochaetota bacterium]|nr:chemotaxis protein CheW [Spirochaetota bacterium]HPP05625.1 chemotaxis protein CheW [Spirochaetota bacterium]